jgi:hypothetical protein
MLSKLDNLYLEGARFWELFYLLKTNARGMQSCLKKVKMDPTEQEK